MERDFYDDSYEEYGEEEAFNEYDSCEFDNLECEGYEWTMEDSWDALTDGMYGDMPNNPMDFDLMMESLGF